MIELWLALISIGLLTYGIRLSFILFFGSRDLPPALGRALRFVPPAVLSAIIFPELALSAGKLFLSPSNPRLIAGILAAIVAWRTKNVMVTILVGMACLWALQAIL